MTMTARPQTIEAGGERQLAPRPGALSEGASRAPAADGSSPGGRSRELFSRLVALPEGTPERERVRAEVVELHLGLAYHLAGRFAGRGESTEDLAQVAMVGLVKAVDRFDPRHGVEFSTFATPTIIGEIKRHFRDTGWAVHVPRRMQELSLAVTRGSAQLAASLGRSATVAELAAHLGVERHEVLEALEAARAYNTRALDAPAPGPGGGDPDGVALADTLGEDDEDLRHVLDRETLRPLLEQLPERERTIVYLRFVHGLSQAQIGARVGVSQMHVSRLLAATLKRLRCHLSVEDLAA